MGSRGSVIPLFREQIEKDLPMTITVSSMTRFLMTLDESVDLVVYAMTCAKGGEVFVRKAAAATVGALAEAMAVKYSRRGRQHPIQNCGIRPGEKLHEILVNEYEMQRVREDDDYFTIYPEYRVNGHLTPKPLGEEYSSQNTRLLIDPADIIARLDAMGNHSSYI
jgi:FlaA1/EpsC-like NDP-sugar epimerase